MAVPEDDPDEEEPGREIWAENWLTVRLFLDLSTQWRLAVGMGCAVWLGLDYPAVLAHLRMRGVKRCDRARIFDGIRIMEGAALPILNRQQAGNNA